MKLRYNCKENKENHYLLCWIGFGVNQTQISASELCVEHIIKATEVFAQFQSQHLDGFTCWSSNRYSHMTWLQSKTWWASRRLESFYGNGSQLLGLGILLLLLFFKHLWGTASYTVVHLGLLGHGCRLVSIHLGGGWGFQGIQGPGWKEARGTLAILGRGGDLGDDRHLDWGGGRGGSGSGGAAGVDRVVLGLFQLILDSQRLLLLLHLAQVVGHEEITARMKIICWFHGPCMWYSLTKGKLHMPRLKYCVCYVRYISQIHR